VAVAWEGREKVSSERLRQEYSDKRKLRPDERKKRLKPLNDLFSMAECCLIADTVQFFKVCTLIPLGFTFNYSVRIFPTSSYRAFFYLSEQERNIPFFPRSCVEDILGVIRDTHLSGNFHRTVAANPEKYFEPKPHLASVLQKLKDSGKKLIFVSNSPFWYVDAGMRYVIGPDWRASWDVVIVSAGKPSFYTDNAKPFREVSSRTGRVKFKKVSETESKCNKHRSYYS
jgi:HAD superfamily 5'-nucleotidase-like hydrolase